ncbi:hypothetical protein BgiBS90_031166 [Biomphalaria glabrata]|uniref:UPAR/Ly6 domain-containing protein n=1 Tax=Biomphalaria glabrata TaxID=6526 RepID=A0A2C9LMK8_BIOGL|nr:hypothetical protein BgiBS90_031166 [Biomphalaria glabrata]
MGKSEDSLFCFMFLLFNMIAHSLSVECLACSYTFAGTDGLTDIECVKSPESFIKTIKIQCTDQCLTRFVYTANYERINSVTRDCSSKYFSGNQCDPATNVYPTCTLTCATSWCNNQTDPKPKSSEEYDPYGNKASTNHIFVCLFFVPIFLLQVV